MPQDGKIFFRITSESYAILIKIIILMKEENK